MKRITLACLARDKQNAIEKLQCLGTVHVVQDAEISSFELERLVQLQEKLNTVFAAFRHLPKEIKPVASAKFEPAIALDKAYALVSELQKTEESIAACSNAIEKLKPWGSFSSDMLKELERRGLYVMLCTSPKGGMPALPDGAVAKIISEEKGQLYFAVFSDKSLQDSGLTAAPLPEQTGLKQWQATLAKNEEKRAALQSSLAGLVTANSDSLQTEEQNMQEMADFIKARDGMEEQGILAFMHGYIPSRKVAELHEAAKKNLWVVEDKEVADDDEQVPTHLIIPKHFKMAKQIFDFVGILPGYHETDVSISMLVFLSIFCGMLVGDAGYGLLFTGVVLYFRKKVRSESARDGMNLLLIMSLSILVYGALCGNWFALPVEKMPGPLGGLPWLSKNNGQKHVQILCFFIAAFHMSMASLWRALQEAAKIDFKEDDIWKFIGCVRSALGQIGWAIFLWANYGLVKLLIVDGGKIEDLTAPYTWFYGIGFVFILLFNINWKDMGAVIYMPFGFINSFVDVLSYIRLFAVGLSSMYIADSFNGMATDLCSGKLWMIPFSLLVLALGHALNIALAAMGVLVHGVRLNTLEFSGRMDLTWCGKPYKPLSIHKK